MTDVIIPREAINDVYIPYLKNTSRVSIFFGGASSGKSVFLAQRDIIDVMKGGRNFLVCRQIGRTLRGSVVQEITKIIKEWGLSELFNVNKTDGTVTCSNGYQIIFAGLDDVEKLKSVTPALGVFTDIRIDEATETDWASIKQLLKRQRGGSKNFPKRLTLSFNPILKSHFLFSEYFSKLGWADDQKEYISPALSILKTTYRDNKFLTPDDVYDLESETDEYYKSVYSDGNWGMLGGVIFTNWRVDDLSEMAAQFTNRRHGLDFGFSSDPAAVVNTHYDTSRKTIYIYRELYETGLTNDILAGRVTEMIGTERIVADSSEPKSIAELNNHSVYAAGAVKGKDSVNFGIDWLKQQTIIVDKSCINMQNELSQYHWKKDAGGNSLKIPVDKNNHLIDALRYAYEDEMQFTWLI